MITRDEIIMEIEARSFEGDTEKLMEAIEKLTARREQEMKLIRRAFWRNIFIGGALLFLAMICLEIVT